MADVITRLKVESNEYDNKLKRASQSLLSMQEAARRTGATMAIAEKEEVKFAQSLGNMQTVARNAKGKLGEMTNALTEMSIVYKRMTDEEKKGEFGRALNASIQQLTQRCKEAKAELADVTKSLGGAGGGFSGVLQEVGGRLGVSSDLMGMLTTGTVAYTAAIGAAAAGAAAAAKAFYDYNTELAQQNQIVEVTTGLMGENADAMRDQMRAVSKVYGVDFRESINAANTLMTQFGISGEEATKLIRKGMQGMIRGDGPKLLQMIQQYAPAYRDAGIEASQLVAIINNTEGGIFTDQNMAAITMGIKNIRMMKDTTKDAMQSIGIDADTMARRLNDGTMSVFDALKQVSDKIDEVGPGSKAAGEIMNDIFGKQGVAAGTNLGKAIAELNLNLEETSRQTGGVGDKLAELTEKTAVFEREMNKAFGVKNFDEFKVAIESDVIDALNGVLITFNNIKDAIKSTGTNFSIAISGMVTMLETLDPKLKILHDIASYFHDIGEEAKYAGDQISSIPDIPTTKDGTPLQGPAGLLAAANSGKTVKPQSEEVKHNPTTYKPNTTKTTTAKPDIYASDSIRAQEKLVTELRDKWNRASGELRDGYKKQLDEAEAKLKEMQGTNIVPKSLADFEQQLSKLKNAQKNVTSAQEWEILDKQIKAVQSRVDALSGGMQKAVKAMQNGDSNVILTLELDSTELDKLKEKIPPESITSTIEVKTEGEPPVIEPKNVTDVVTIKTEGEPPVIEPQNVTDVVTIKTEGEPPVIEPQNVTSTVSIDVHNAEQLDELNKYLKSIGKEPISIDIVPNVKMQTGISGFKATSIDYLTKQIKDDLANTEFGTPLYNSLRNQLADVTAINNIIETAFKNGLKIDSSAFEGIWENIGDSIDIHESVWQTLINDINAKLQDKKIRLNFETGEITTDNVKPDEDKRGIENKKWFQDTGKVVNGLSQVASGLQSMGVKLPESVQKTLAVLQGVMSIIQGVGSIISVFSTTSETANTAAVVANTAAMGALTSAVIANTATGWIPFFANGGFTKAANGVITGSHFSGDVQPLLVNAGEGVINQADQAALWRSIKEGNFGGGGSIQSVGVRGTDLLLCLNNELRSQGKPTL